MQKIRAKIPVYLMIIPVAASCVLRFFQLLNFTDKSTGNTFGSGIKLSFVTYALLAAALIFDALYSKNKIQLKPRLDFNKGGRLQNAACVFLAVACFADFLHRIYNCYNHVSKIGYMEYAYLLPMAVSGLIALLCCFYFVCVLKTLKGSNYDFRNFTFFHFAPIAWCFSNLIIMMLHIIDVKKNTEGVLEFLLMVFITMFFFCYVSMLDKSGNVSVLFIFFANAVLIFSTALVLPRYAVMISGNAELLRTEEYTGLTYIALGVFSSVFSIKALKTTD